MNNQKYPIGTKYISRNKRKDICTVTDFLTTTNSKGEIVKTRYVATHVFMGQTVTDYDVIEGSITMSIGELGNLNEEKVA